MTKMLLIILTAGVVLAAAQATMAVIAVILLAWFVWSLFTCPKELLALLGFLAMVGLMHAQPLAFLGVLALMTIASMLRRT